MRGISAGKRPKRRKYLISPKVQLTFALLLAVSTGIAVVFFGLILWHLLGDFASAELAASLEQAGLRAALITVLIVTPLVVSLAILATHPVVGPIYRFDLFLRAVLDDGESRACHIRRYDEMQDLCVLLNRATEELRARNAERAAQEEAPDGGAEETAKADADLDRAA